MPNEVHVVEGPQGFALICAGDPNGAIRAPKGTLAVDNVTPAMWQNSNGVTTWVVVGSGGGGGFPITEDDGTYTYTIDAATGNLTGTVTDDAASQYVSQFGASSDAGDSATGFLQANSPTHDASIAANALEAQGGYIEISTDGQSADLIAGEGDPNGVVTALEASLYFQVDGPALWQNVDGTDTWQSVSGGFPVTKDDGTTTFGIIAASKTMALAADDNGTSHSASLTLVGDATAGNNFAHLFTNVAGGRVQLGSGSGDHVTAGGASDQLGFYGHATAAQPTVTGSKGANAALASLMTALAALGLVIDTTT